MCDCGTYTISTTLFKTMSINVRSSVRLSIGWVVWQFKVCGSSSCNPMASGHVSQLGLAFSTPVRFRDKLWSDNKTTGVSHFQIQISPIVVHKDTCHVSTFLPPHFQINSYIDMLSFCEPKKISRFPGNISLFRISGKIGWGAKQLVGKQSDNNQAGAVSDWGQHENLPSNQHDSSG